jgi:Putative inner membrane protein (DUF1819)
MPTASERGSSLAPPDQQPIRARLAGAGSLRGELEALLTATPAKASVAEYRALVIDQNVAGKRSAAARLGAWRRLKLRYALDPSIAEHRAFLDGMQATTDAAERGLLEFLMFSRTDRLFREVTLEEVSPHLSRPGTVVEPAVVRDAICQHLRQQRLNWSAATVDHTSQHLLSTLKDFAVVRGSRVRRTVRPRPGEQATLFAARLGRLEGLSDRQQIESCWFRLFGLEGHDVRGLLHGAHRSGVLDFRAQADVLELKLPPLPEHE